MQVKLHDSGRVYMEFDPDETNAAYNALIFLAQNAAEKDFADQLMSIAQQLMKEISMMNTSSRLQ